MSTETQPLDTWLKFYADPADNGEDQAEYEANTFLDDGWYRVEWYHTAVGLVSSQEFRTHDEAREWLTSQGFQDFSN